MELLDEAWRAREADAPLESLTFTDEGLVLGAGTVLAAVDSATGPRRVKLDSDQRGLLALLSAAYARRVGPEVLPHIRRASTRWRDGETELAAVHLALTGLGRLSRVAARRLFAADLLMEAGAAPETIMKAMGLGICSPDLVRYRPDQPRVPPGSGRNSGQWTTEPGGGVPADQARSPIPSTTSSARGPSATRTGPESQPALPKRPRRRRLSSSVRTAGPRPPKTPSPKDRSALRLSPQNRIATPPQKPTEILRPVLDDPSPSLLNWLGRIAIRSSAPAVFFRVLLTPTKAGSAQSTISIPGRPDMRIVKQADETFWQVVEDGGATGTLERPNGELQDKHGQIIGRVLPGGDVAIDLQTVTVLKPGDPQICPVPGPDKEGKGEKGSARDYEDQIKALINPDAPTPRGYGVALINPATGDPVFFDDCQRRTGAMIEAKGPGTARVIEASQGRGFRSNVEARFLDQSARQLQAAGGRPVISFCAEKRTADYLRELFKERDEGRSKIVIAWVPFVGRQR